MVRRVPLRHVRAREHRDRARVRAGARVRRLVLGVPRDQARHGAAPDVPAARGRRLAPRARRRPAVRRLHPRADVRALRRRRVRAAARRRGHALPRARHQAPRRLLLVGHRALRPARRRGSGPKRDVTAELADAVRAARPHVRLLLLAARLEPPRVSRSGALRRRVHAPADPGARRAVRARAAVGRRPLGSSRRALARRRDPRRRARGRGRARLRDRVQRPLLRVASPTSRCTSTTFPTVAARRAVGAVPRARLLVLREPQRARRGPPHRRAGRRAARRDGRQGRQPVAQRRPERRRHHARDPGAASCATSGAWVRAHADAIHGSTRFDVPGDGQHWYTRAGDDVHAFDLSSAPEPRFAGLGGARGVCDAPTAPTLDVPRRRRACSSIDARAVARHPFGTRYVVELGAREHVDGRRAARRAARRAPGGATRRSPRRSRARPRATWSTSAPAGTRARSASSSRSSCPRA